MSRAIPMHMVDLPLHELREELALAQLDLYGHHRTALHRACAELAVDFLRQRVVAAMKRAVHPRREPTLEQVFDRLHAAGVKITVIGG